MSKFFSSAIRHSKHSPSIKEYPPLTESESRKIEKKVMAGQRKYKEPLPDFAQSLSKSKQSGDDRLSYFDSLKVLRAGGVPAKTVLKDQAGSIADKVLSTAMKRVALMPIAYIKPVIGSIAGIQPSKLPGAANASIQGTRGTLQLAVSGATQSLEKFSFFGRSLTPKEAEIAVPKGLVHKLENIAQDFQALAAEKRSKHSPNESATKSGDLDEFRQKVSRELTRLIEKDGGARQALFADERVRAQTVAAYAGLVVDIVAKGAGGAALASADLGILTQALSLATYPAMAGLSQLISSWYDTKAIAGLAVHKYDELQALKPDEAPSNEDLQALANKIQDGFESSKLANHSRRNTNVFQPELASIKLKQAKAEYKADEFAQRLSAQTREQLALIERRLKVRREINGVNLRFRKADIENDVADVNTLIEYAQSESVSDEDFDFFVRRNAGALMNVSVFENKEAVELMAQFDEAQKARGDKHSGIWLKSEYDDAVLAAGGSISRAGFRWADTAKDFERAKYLRKNFGLMNEKAALTAKLTSIDRDIALSKDDPSHEEVAPTAEFTEGQKKFEQQRDMYSERSQALALAHERYARDVDSYNAGRASEIKNGSVAQSLLHFDRRLVSGMKEAYTRDLKTRVKAGTVGIAIQIGDAFVAPAVADWASGNPGFGGGKPKLMRAVAPDSIVDSGDDLADKAVTKDLPPTLESGGQTVESRLVNWPTSKAAIELKEVNAKVTAKKPLFEAKQAELAAATQRKASLNTELTGLRKEEGDLWFFQREKKRNIKAKIDTAQGKVDAETALEKSIQDGIDALGYDGLLKQQSKLKLRVSAEKVKRLILKLERIESNIAIEKQNDLNLKAVENDIKTRKAERATRIKNGELETSDGIRKIDKSLAILDENRREIQAVVINRSPLIAARPALILKLHAKLEAELRVLHGSEIEDSNDGVQSKPKITFGRKAAKVLVGAAAGAVSGALTGGEEGAGVGAAIAALLEVLDEDDEESLPEDVGEGLINGMNGGFMVKQGAALFKAANAAPVIEGTGESEILETTGATEGGPSGDVKVEGNPGEAAAAEGQSVLNTVDDPLPEFGPAAALLRESRVFSRPGSQYVRNANKFKHAFDESDPNIIMSTTKTDRVYNVFRNSYKEDEWTLYSNYRYHQDGEFYANDVTAIQYEKVSKARGFYGKLPKRIVRDNVQNTETLTMTAGLGSGSPELAEAFFKTPNGRHTKRIMDDFGLEASSVDWVWGEDGVAKTFTVNVRPKTPGAASG